MPANLPVRIGALSGSALALPFGMPILWQMEQPTQTITAQSRAISPQAAIEEGDQLWQLGGTSDRLVARAGRVAARPRADADGVTQGALVVCCGGCMLARQGRMDDVHAGIDAALGNVPRLGVFTFGEQGTPRVGHPKHGNLMISCTVFGKD